MKIQIFHYCSCCVASDTVYGDAETAIEAAKKLAKTVPTYLRVCAITDRSCIELIRVTSGGVVKIVSCAEHADCLESKELAEACFRKSVEALS